MAADGRARSTCWCGCCSATATRRSLPALLLALTPQQIIWSATAAVEPTASLAAVARAVVRRALSALGRRGGARRGGRRRGLRRAVPPGIAADPAGRWLLIVAAAARGARAAARLVGRPAVPGARGRPHRTPVRGQEHATGEPARRGSRWRTSPPTSAVNGWFYLGDERFPLLFTLLALVGLTRPASRPERVWRWRSISCCSSRSVWCSTPAATTTAPTCAIR